MEITIFVEINHHRSSINGSFSIAVLNKHRVTTSRLADVNCWVFSDETSIAS